MAPLNIQNHEYVILRFQICHSFLYKLQCLIWMTDNLLKHPWDRQLIFMFLQEGLRLLANEQIFIW